MFSRDIPKLPGYKERKTPQRFNGEHGEQVFSIFNKGDYVCFQGHKSHSPIIKLGIPQSPHHGRERTIYGWRLTTKRIYCDWEAIDRMSRDEGFLRYAFKKKHITEDERSQLQGLSWCIRGFFIGRYETHAPPYVVALCSEPGVAKLVAKIIPCILKEGGLSGNSDWSTTYLEGVTVQDLGRGGGDDNYDDYEDYDDDEDYHDYKDYDNDENLDEIVEDYGSNNDNDQVRDQSPKDDPEPLQNAGRTYVEENFRRPRAPAREYRSNDPPPMAPKLVVVPVELSGDYPVVADVSLRIRQLNRCGLPIRVTRDESVVCYGTLGGLIDVGGKVYGLTVAHIFLNGIKLVQTLDEDAIFAPTSSTHSDPSELLTIWNLHKCYSIDLDWALIEIPSFNTRVTEDTKDGKYRLNSVQTASGGLSPIFVSENEPSYGALVTLATPNCTFGLRGYFVGSEAVLNIPDCTQPYSVWVIRMEEPWLIQKGDSGSWVLDAFTGNLIGILIASCQDLRETYILPAWKVFDDIEKHYGSSVRLVNGFNIHKSAAKSPSSGDQDLTKKQRELNILFFEEQDIIRSYKALRNFSLENLYLGRHRICNEIVAWEKSWKLKADAISGGSGKLKNRLEPITDWLNPLKLYQARSNWTDGHKQFDCPNDFEDTSVNCESMLLDAKTVLQESDLPFKSYDLMNELWKKYLLQSSSWTNPFIIEPGLKDQNGYMNSMSTMIVANTIWDHLVLGNPIDRFPVNTAEIGRYSDVEKHLIRYNGFRSHIYQGWIADLPTLEKYPWDRRHSATEDLIDLLGRILKNELYERKSISMLDLTGVGDSKPSADISTTVLGVLVTDEEDDRTLAIVTPDYFSEPRREEHWSESLGKAYRIPGDDNLVRFSDFRLPLAVRNADFSKEENLREIVYEQLGLEHIPWKKYCRLTWGLESPKYYSKELGQEVSIEFFKVIISSSRWPEGGINKNGWAVVTYKLDDIKGKFKEPLFCRVVERCQVMDRVQLHNGFSRFANLSSWS